MRGLITVHRTALMTCLATIFLLSAGALVTGTGSGLAVPDWPLSYGKMMPPMVGGVFYEHGHRLVAGVVLIMMVLLSLNVFFTEERSSVRYLTLLAMLAVLSQALLGGLTVLLRLPKAVSIAHACLGQVFFVLVTVITMISSEWWQKETQGIHSSRTAQFLVSVAMVINVLFFIQLFLGATMRHFGAGLAIPDFPLVFGGVVPKIGSFEIWVHYLHRVGAVAIVASVAFLVFLTLTYFYQQDELSVLVGLLATVLSIQVLLGAMVIWLRRPVWLTTSHLVMGAISFSLATCVNFWVRKLSRQSLLVEGRGAVIK